MIVVEQVSHRYGARTVLHELSLDLAEQRIGVIGANGSGKSTFVRLLNGLLLPTSGRVVVNGLDTKPDGPAVRRDVGFVFQNPDDQIVLPTVAEDVAFSLRGRKLPPAIVEERVDAVLHRHGLLPFKEHPAHLLSGGQKQLLAICSALVGDPSCLVLDEPTTLLDRRNAAQIARTLAEVPQQVVVATHDLDLVEICQRVLVFDEGRLVADEAPDRAVARYRSIVG